MNVGVGIPVIGKCVALQLIAGVLLVIRKTRELGAILAAVNFIVAVVLITISEINRFAVIELIPVQLEKSRSLLIMSQDEDSKHTLTL